MTLKKIKKEDYDFFDNIERYIINGERIEDTIHIDELSTDCNSFYDYWERTSSNKEIAKNICNKLVGLYKKLKEGNINYSKENNYMKDFAFLNYWTNWKIYNELYGSTSVSNFYDLIGSHVELDSPLEFVNDYIYDFDKNDLYKMNILYSLYAKYSKLNAVIESKLVLDKEAFLSLSNECCTDYNKTNYICNDNNNTSIFCKKLNDFMLKYGELYSNIDKKKPEFSDYFKSLSSCGNTKIISTAVTGTFLGLIPLFGVLYKVSELNILL
ncbi:hypothetical protein PVBG_06104 [Plasmodium vivax Brazil I]|uniref:VIR protein n=1 Tax=Plasmodium vivax (strain Brazil I) TaxID=1033975 RepID=A0A0J9VBB1_PLAV1|nr:hypothetical protein PVBG_06104 [Plasmodium vivax Brazil I]